MERRSAYRRPTPDPGGSVTTECRLGGPLARAFLAALAVETEEGVRQLLETRRVDRTPTALAGPVGAFVDAHDRPGHLIDQVGDVVADRQVALSFERRGTGVREVLVEADLARDVGLRSVERVRLELRLPLLKLGSLVFEAL